MPNNNRTKLRIKSMRWTSLVNLKQRVKNLKVENAKLKRGKAISPEKIATDAALHDTAWQ